jgi:hypothetical protein
MLASHGFLRFFDGKLLEDWFLADSGRIEAQLG